jgi:hypothetical protein
LWKRRAISCETRPVPQSQNENAWHVVSCGIWASSEPWLNRFEPHREISNA